GASYSTSYAYTHLGQLWQGPTNGIGAQQQYLYCDSSHPHQVSALSALGATCSNRGTASYGASYDAWGNLTTRTINTSTGTLSYDALDYLTQWDGGSAGNEQYLYDTTGERALKRSTSGGVTSLRSTPSASKSTPIPSSISPMRLAQSSRPSTQWLAVRYCWATSSMARMATSATKQATWEQIKGTPVSTTTPYRGWTTITPDT